MDIAETVGKARRAGTPLVAISTPDPAHTIEIIHNWHQGNDKSDVGMVIWDIISGFTARNDVGSQAIARIVKTPTVENPVLMLKALAATAVNAVGDDSLLLGTKNIVFVHMAHRFLDNAQVLQGIWNLRDSFKNTENTLVLLGPRVKLPAELSNDVLLIEEELPNDTRLAQIVGDVYTNAEIDQPDEVYVIRCVDGVRGLSAFIAEQNLAMSMRKDGVDIEYLWSLKQSSIENTAGVKFHYKSPFTFDDIGGNETIIDTLNSVAKGRKRARVIVWIDEIEKALAGASGRMQESSGTSADALQVLLKLMEDNDYTGVILVGVAGSGKTMTARAFGSTHRIPTLEVDINGTKDSLVGSSEQRMRAVAKMVEGMAGGGSALFIATSNNLDSLPPELKRRFRLGTYYFDLPSVEEREAIWTVQRRRYEIDPADTIPDDTDWTGADIRNCCENAWSMGWTLAKAATRISPIAKTDPDRIEALRNQADGHYLSASYDGTWTREAMRKRADSSSKRRKIEVG